MQGIATTFDDVSFDRDRDWRQVSRQIGPGVIVVAALAAFVGAWVLHGRPAVAPDVPIARSTAVPAPAPKASVASNPYGEIFDPGFFSNGKPSSLTRDYPPPQASSEAPAPMTAIAQPDGVPLPPKRDFDQSGESPPLPPPRPAELKAAAAPVTPAATDHGSAQQNGGGRVGRAATPGDNRTFFEKLFGVAQPAGAGTAVSYAAPEGRVGVKPFFAPSSPPAGYDRWTAVYDISARTVYLPDGTRLEAHSGLGDRLDDPAHVNERLRGATPPHLYELEPREASFHGVQALRLKPVGQGDLFGRAGLLAHSYMLGPNGDSNGCVSFKDYDAFLRAYQSGQVKRLAVVARSG
jgi:hypothetical protein